MCTYTHHCVMICYGAQSVYKDTGGTHGIKLRGLLLTGSTDQHMASQNGLV